MNKTRIELSSMPPNHEAALHIVAQAAASLFIHGQTTEQTILAAERLGDALGAPIHVLPYWGELVVEIDGTPRTEIVPATPLGVDMGRVLAVMNVVDRICNGTLPPEAAPAALTAAAHVPPASTPRFALLAAIAASALGVIFGAFDPASLLLIAGTAGLGAFVRRGLARLGGNPFVQPLCAAAIAGVIGAVAGRWGLAAAPSLVAYCPCMVLVPGPHILNAAIDLARTRIALGVDRFTYATMIVLMICIGVLPGLALGGSTVQAAGPAVPVPLAADVIAAGCAVAGYGTFFSMPWRLLPLPIAVGMLAHAARWALISLAGANVAAGALVASLLVGVIVTPVVDRLRLPFAAVAFSAVVSMLPGFYLFHAASALAALVLASAPSPDLVTNGVANAATAFMIVLAMTFGLILPRMLFARFLPVPTLHRPRPEIRNPPH
ncbi:MAG TPA: threonine/serine exporter family protein [Acetobacteraceae bacterium]|nr:threonine/serine exporter family protein [Acetobacteraceae bacterium]